MRLSVENHDRDRAGLTYVYPVVSRRAGGVSVGINLNPNDACNFRCVYCQVPGLVYGKAPEIDLALLERELRGFLDQLVHGDYMQRVVPAGSRRLNDLALSGNGEPTSAREFDEVIELLGLVMRDYGLLPRTKLVLITNGSLVGQPQVRRGLERMRASCGEVWFKLDSGTDAGLARINGYQGGIERVLEQLAICTPLCPTWIQTCAFDWAGGPDPELERASYLDALRRVLDLSTPIEGVLLYGLARQSQQPEAPLLARRSSERMHALGEAIRSLGFEVRVSE